VIKTDRERAATVLYTALRCVDNLKTLMTPFMPFSSQQIHEMLGYEGYLAGPLEFHDFTEEDGRSHRVLTGNYPSWVGHWQPSTLPIGRPIGKPQPLFKKLDESVIEEELARMAERGA
jgi:methionyl-tRNA synthetase